MWSSRVLGGFVALGLCGASDPAAQRNIDRILEEHGPGQFLERFLEARGLAWAAALIDQFPALTKGEEQ